MLKLSAFRLPEDLRKEIERLSKLERVTQGTWVRDALWKAVEEKTRRPIAAIVKEAYRRERREK